MTNNWKRIFFPIWIGQAFSLLGSMLVDFAIIWWLTADTGSATVLAIATLCEVMPRVIIGPFAGALVDRLKRKWVMVGADAAIAATTLVFAWLFSQNAITIWHIYILLFIRATGGLFHENAMQSATSLMVPESQLTRVSGLNMTLRGAMRIASPMLGALLISLISMQQVLLIDVGTALIAILPLLFVTVPEPQKTTAHQQTGAGIIQDVRAGLKYTFSWKGLAIIMLASTAIDLLAMPALNLMPILVTQKLGGAASELAIVESAFGLGYLLGGVLLGVWGGFKKRINTSLLGLLLSGAALLAIWITPGSAFEVTVGLIAVVGLSLPIVNGPMGALIQTYVRPEMQGRVFTLSGAMSGIGTPLSLLIAGPVADAVGINIWYLIGGLGIIGVGLIMGTQKVVREIESSEQAKDARQAISVASSANITE